MRTAHSGVLAAFATPVLKGLIEAAFLACSPARAQHGPAVGPLPGGEGSDIVGVVCTQCHAPNAFTQLRQGPSAWRAQVHDMILRGAQVGPAEIEPVVKYLSTHFGPGINVPAAVLPGSLPEGAGRDLVEQNCGLCHAMDRIAGARRSSREWDAIMARMTVLGQPATGDEARRIKAYLNEHFGAH